MRVRWQDLEDHLVELLLQTLKACTRQEVQLQDEGRVEVEQDVSLRLQDIHHVFEGGNLHRPDHRDRSRASCSDVAHHVVGDLWGNGWWV